MEKNKLVHDSHDQDIPEGISVLESMPRFEKFVDKNKLTQYKEYCEKTRDENGVEMPSEEVFGKKLKIAVDIFPQKDENGRVRYLFGKGVGAELALRGEVLGREKNEKNFPYRSHSDFEIYDYNGDFTESEDAKNFRSVFGAEEIYPKSGTKALENIPEDYMDRTYEVVKYNGDEYLIPELELLFLDKYLRQESTPRDEGCDAVLLAKEYDLDVDTILAHFDNFVAKPELDRLKNEEADRMLLKKKYILNKLDEMLSNIVDETDFNESTIDKMLETISNDLSDRIEFYKRQNYYGFSCMPSKVSVKQNEAGSFEVNKTCLDQIDELIAQESNREKEQITELRARLEELLQNINSPENQQ